MLEMQADKLARYSIELHCLTSILFELLTNSDGNLPKHTVANISAIADRYAKRIQTIAINHHCDIEYKIL